MFGASLTVFRDQCPIGEDMLRTYQSDLSEIGIFAQEEHQGFCFGVSKPNVILEHFRTVPSYHETGKQDTNEREACLTSGESMQYVAECVLPSFLIPSKVGCNVSLRIRSMRAGVAIGAGA